MKKHYDFSKGERGKFYHPNAVFNIPIYLEQNVAQFIKEIAESRNTNMNDIVNTLLMKDKELMESMKKVANTQNLVAEL